MTEAVFRWESESGFAAFTMAKPHDNTLLLYDRDGVCPPGPFRLKELIDKRERPGRRPLCDFPFGGALRTAMISGKARDLLGSALVGDFHLCEVAGVDREYWMFRSGLSGSFLLPGSSLAPLQENYQFDIAAIPLGQPFCATMGGYTCMFFDDAFGALVARYGLVGLGRRVVWTRLDGPYLGRVVAGSYRLSGKGSS